MSRPQLAEDPETLRQALVRGCGDVIVADVPRAALAPGEIRIEIAYAGICGSELHHILDPERHGALPADAYGHEYSGVVREVGDGVVSVASGDRVTCVPRLPCLRCGPCREGRIVSCRDQIRAARGAWAQEIVVRDRFAFALPDALGLRAAALCEPLACVLRGIDRAQAPAGHVAVVIGGGPIGLMAVALAAASGAREVLLAEPRPARRRLAEQLGATAVDPHEGALEAAVLEATEGRGATVVYEAVGLPQCVAEGLELLAPGGTLCVLGLAAPDALAPIRPYRLFDRDLTIVSAWGHETTFARALAWLPRLDLGGIVTHELPLERVAEAIDVAASGDCGKVMLLPNGRLDVD